MLTPLTEASASLAVAGSSIEGAGIWLVLWRGSRRRERMEMGEWGGKSRLRLNRGKHKSSTYAASGTMQGWETGFSGFFFRFLRFFPFFSNEENILKNFLKMFLKNLFLQNF